MNKINKYIDMKNIINFITEKVGWHFIDAQEENDIMCVMIDNFTIEFASKDDEEYWESLDDDIREKVLDMTRKGQSVYDKEYGNFYLKVKNDEKDED